MANIASAGRSAEERGQSEQSAEPEPEREPERRQRQREHYVAHWHEDRNITCGTVIFQLEHCAHFPLAPIRKVECSCTISASKTNRQKHLRHGYQGGNH
jgi:hypothetical protein